MRALIFCLLLAYAHADPLFGQPAQEEFQDLEQESYDARIFTSSECRALKSPTMLLGVLFHIQTSQNAGEKLLRGRRNARRRSLLVTTVGKYL